MEADGFMIECLKFSFALISSIMDFIIKVDEENYLNLIVPFIYYLSEYKN